jgi:hypothetical protein
MSYYDDDDDGIKKDKSRINRDKIPIRMFTTQDIDELITSIDVQPTVPVKESPRHQDVTIVPQRSIDDNKDDDDDDDNDNDNDLDFDVTDPFSEELNLNGHNITPTEAAILGFGNPLILSEEELRSILRLTNPNRVNDQSGLSLMDMRGMVQEYMETASPETIVQNALAISAPPQSPAQEPKIDERIELFLLYKAKMYHVKTQKISDASKAADDLLTELLESNKLQKTSPQVTKNILACQASVRQLNVELLKADIIPTQDKSNKAMRKLNEFATILKAKWNLSKFVSKSSTKQSPIMIPNEIIATWVSSSIELTPPSSACRRLFDYKIQKWSKWFEARSLILNDLATVESAKKPDVILAYLYRAPFLIELYEFLNYDETIMGLLSTESQSAWRALLIPFKTLLRVNAYPTIIKTLYAQQRHEVISLCAKIILKSLPKTIITRSCQEPLTVSKIEAMTSVPQSEKELLIWMRYVPLHVASLLSRHPNLSEVSISASKSLLLWLYNIPLDKKTQDIILTQTPQEHRQWMQSLISHHDKNTDRLKTLYSLW